MHSKIAKSIIYNTKRIKRQLDKIEGSKRYKRKEKKLLKIRNELKRL